MRCVNAVGNQLLILLISFTAVYRAIQVSWESVTNPLDKLCATSVKTALTLGISY